MSDPNNQYAYFCIQGDFDPQEITDRVGLTPSRSWRKGDIHPKRQYERKFSHWELRSTLDQNHSLEEHLSDVLSQLERSPEAIIAVSQQLQGWMQLVGFFHEGFPGIHFEPDHVTGMAKFKLSVDFDLYNLWSDSREGT